MELRVATREERFGGEEDDLELRCLIIDYIREHCADVLGPNLSMLLEPQGLEKFQLRYLYGYAGGTGSADRAHRDASGSPEANHPADRISEAQAKHRKAA